MLRHILGVFFVALAMQLFGGAVVPDRAQAQVDCPDLDGSNVSGSIVIRYLGSDGSTCNVLGNIFASVYNNPLGSGHTRPFELFLPGSTDIPANSNAVKVIGRDGAGVALTVTDIQCEGASMVPNTDARVPEIVLSIGQSCLLYVYWENGDNSMSFAGGRLSREASSYKIDTNGILAGGPFGGTAATTNGLAIDVERDTMVFNDGDTDDIGDKTAGTAETLTYKIRNTGNEEVTINSILVDALDNISGGVDLADPANSNRDLADTTINIAVGDDFEFTATFTPEDPTDFSFNIVIANSDVTMLEFTVKGSAAVATVTSITVERDGVFYNDGDTDDHGTKQAGVPVVVDYTITNTGNEGLSIYFNAGVITKLNLAGDIAVQDLDDLTRDLSGDFPVSADDPPPLQLPAQAVYFVRVTYTPKDPGSFSFDFNVAYLGNTSGTEGGIGFTVSGTAKENSEDITQRTQRIIANFMGRRAAQIVAQEPDLTKRLGDGGNSSRGGPVNVTGEGTAHNNTLAFATSLRQAIGSTQIAKQKRIGDVASRMALGARNESGDGSLKDGPATGADAAPATGFGLWAEGTWARVDNDTAESDFGLLYVGADYRFNAGLVVGFIAQFDRMDETDVVNDFAIEGKGWMAGPYIVARLTDNLIFDARAAWGRSDNEVSPFNTYTDNFDGQRRLLRGRLTGDFSFGALHVAPHVGVIYFDEEQKAYIDSNGYAIGSQTVKLGRLTFGPKISTSFNRPDGTTIAPFVAVQGIWDFKRTDQVDIDTGYAVTGTDGLRARAEAGLSVRLPQGIAITGEGFYDGIGADGYDAYGGSVKVGVPF